MSSHLPQVARADFALVGTQQGFLYSIGGRDGVHDHASCEMLDVVTESWYFVNPLQRPRSGIAAAYCSGMIFVMGGWRQAEANIGGLKDVEALTLSMDNANEWLSIAPMHTARPFPGAAALKGKIYVLGGRSVTAEVYDPGTNTWNSVASLTQQRWGPGRS